MRKHILEAAVYFILAVAVFDIYCTSRYRIDIRYGELNPVAKMFIQKFDHKFKVTSGPEFITTYLTVEDNDVSKLILFKVLGMLAAKSILMSVLNSERKHVATAIISIVFLVQCFLLFILLM